MHDDNDVIQGESLGTRLTLLRLDLFHTFNKGRSGRQILYLGMFGPMLSLCKCRTSCLNKSSLWMTLEWLDLLTVYLPSVPFDLCS